MMLRIALLITATLMLGDLANAQTAAQPDQNPPAVLGERQLQLEPQQPVGAQQIESEKLRLERDKLEDDRNKTYATILGAFLVFVVGILTILGQFRLKRKDFVMKAAEIVMDADSATETRGRAHALTTLFGNMIPKNFGQELDPSAYGEKFALLPRRSADAQKLRDVGAAVHAVNPDVVIKAIQQGTEAQIADSTSKEYLFNQWAKEIDERKMHYLAYVYERSQQPGMFDVTIFLMRFVWGEEPNQYKLDNVESADFYFGPSWEEVFTARPSSATGGIVGVRISAWGSFWATCRVKFTTDTEPIILHRVIDFQMPPY
jgi:hypothetical protein